LQEIAQQVVAYLKDSLLVSLILAFVAGMAASKTVAYDRRSGVVFFLIVGLLGLFLGEFVIFYFHLDEYLVKIANFRIVFDLIAAYVGSFVPAAIIHFIKPT
jgi:uncharacterized membrane protein YeaQ/YmgE (transglycosylase-associated protein family)